MTKQTKWHVRPAKTQISLGIRPVWSESSLSAWRKLGSLATHWVHSEDSDQTGRMPRLIWVFDGHTVILLDLSWCGKYHCSAKNSKTELHKDADIADPALDGLYFLQERTQFWDSLGPLPPPHPTKRSQTKLGNSRLSLYTSTESLSSVGTEKSSKFTLKLWNLHEQAFTSILLVLFRCHEFP